MSFKPVVTYIIFLLASLGCGRAPKAPPTVPGNDYWIMTADSITDKQGYRNASGQIVIPFGKYAFCFSDTFKTYALVQLNSGVFAIIDRQEKVLYEVFNFDNGPDYPEEGLFRIVVQGKIGYADEKTFAVVIPPQFDCAFPFENGLAKVSTNCTSKVDGEHHTWVSDHWTYIDKKGKAVSPPAGH